MNWPPHNPFHGLCGPCRVINHILMLPKFIKSWFKSKSRLQVEYFQPIRCYFLCLFLSIPKFYGVRRSTHIIAILPQDVNIAWKSYKLSPMCTLTEMMGKCVAFLALCRTSKFSLSPNFRIKCFAIFKIWISTKRLHIANRSRVSICVIKILLGKCSSL